MVGKTAASRAPGWRWPFGRASSTDGDPADRSKLPPGDIGRSIFGNTFTFHDNAQELVLSAVRKHPDAKIVRMRVINRDVALVIDHQLAHEVLEAWQQSSRQESSPERSMPTRPSSGDPDNARPPRFSHREAYRPLIGAFFSEPNILLEDEDEPERSSHRLAWDKHMSALLSSDSTAWEELDRQFRCIVRSHKDEWARSDAFDLYRSCKDLAHVLVFSLFLDLSPHDGEYDLAVRTTDTSLRGQFSLPVKFGLPGGFGETAYSRGLKAHTEFNHLVSSRVTSGRCPFLHTDPPPKLPPDSLVSHISTFSSSLVIKALSSYLTFALLQRSRHRQSELNHLLLETERLCPPIIGVMRRVTDQEWKASEELEVPAGWDAWLYFPLINRDPTRYGADARVFRAERWMNADLSEPVSFGHGGKICLGRSIVRRIVSIVLEEIWEGAQMEILSQLEPSMCDFLGWQRDEGHGEAQMWGSVKQLPVQRPKEPVMVALHGTRE